MALAYHAYGRVIRGPAPLPLKLVGVKVEGGYIGISPWTDRSPALGKVRGFSSN